MRPRRNTHRWAAVPMLALLAACQPAARPEPEAGPADAAPGTCWHREVTPALIETVTEQRREDPAANTAAPARYSSVTEQRILRPRSTHWFEIPCDRETGPEFTASLQRALAARGVYKGPVTGRIDSATRDAIRAFQQPLGIDSAILSRLAARRLGLVLHAPPPARPV